MTEARLVTALDNLKRGLAMLEEHHQQHHAELAAAPAEPLEFTQGPLTGQPSHDCEDALAAQEQRDTTIYVRQKPAAAAPAEGPPHRDTRVPPDLSDDPEGEHCYDCGQAVGVVWTAPDAMWAEVTDRADGGGLLCVRCFDRRAEQRGRPLRWVPQPLAALAEGLLEAAWGIIANANGGNWDTASPEWREAAIRWREQYHAALARHESAGEQRIGSDIMRSPVVHPEDYGLEP